MRFANVITRGNNLLSMIVFSLRAHRVGPAHSGLGIHNCFQHPGGSHSCPYSQRMPSTFWSSLGGPERKTVNGSTGLTAPRRLYSSTFPPPAGMNIPMPANERVFGCAGAGPLPSDRPTWLATRSGCVNVYVQNPQWPIDTTHLVLSH